MNLTIIGTGNMGSAIGRRAVAGGHDVTLIGRDPDQVRQLADELGGSAKAGDAIDGDLVVLAVYYPDSQQAVEQYADGLEGRVVVDICNPVNDSFSGLVTPGDSSAAQELAQKLPSGARLVKAFNHTFARTLAAGEVAGQPLDVLIAGDDEDAKAKVRELIESSGLRAIDAGGLVRARELEAVGFLHMQLQQSLGTGFGSALKFVA